MESSASPTGTANATVPGVSAHFLKVYNARLGSRISECRLLMLCVCVLTTSLSGRNSLLSSLQRYVKRESDDHHRNSHGKNADRRRTALLLL